MDDLYPGYPKKKDTKESATRILKRLKIALLIWILCLLAFIIWFSFFSAF